MRVPFEIPRGRVAPKPQAPGASSNALRVGSRRAGAVSSHLRARVDVQLRLKGEPKELPWISLAGFSPQSYDWTRNAPAKADKLDVQLLADDFPFDLDIIEDSGGRIQGWLYEHDEMTRCAPGDAGYFSGIIDTIERDRSGNSLTLSCRDLTGALLDRKLDEAEIAAIDIAPYSTLDAIIHGLMRFVDGGETWPREYIVPVGDTVLGANALETLGKALPTPPKIVPKKARKLTGPEKILNRVLSGRQNHLADLVGKDKKPSVWDAISSVCARFGVVPEVTMSNSGQPMIVIIDASTLQTSTVLRPFERNGKLWRILTDGKNVKRLKEKLELSASTKRPDGVVVACVNPVTAMTYRGVYPPKADLVDGANLIYQSVDGIFDQRWMEVLARRGYESLAHNQFELELEVKIPWSTGGGPSDPDMLDCAYGAGLEVAVRGYDELVKDPATAIIARRKMKPEYAMRIAQAQARVGKASLTFQVAEVQHNWTNAPSYACKLRCRRFIGTKDDAELFGGLKGSAAGLTGLGVQF